MSVASPCVKVCVLDPERRICIGCGRTMAEISAWPHMGDAQRSAVRRDLGRRLKTMRSAAV